MNLKRWFYGMAVGVLAFIASAGVCDVDVTCVGVTIQKIPNVAIGDEGDIHQTSTTTLHLLRYVNLVNLDSITNEPNSGDPSKLKFWYETTNSTLRVSNSQSLIEPMTPEESEKFRASNPTPPPARKEIAKGGDFWMSLIHDAPGAGMQHAVSAVSATAGENGNTTQGLTKAGIFGVDRVALYAIDDVLTSTSYGQMSFDVYTLLGERDSYSPDKTRVYEATFEGDRDYYWTFQTVPGIGFLPGYKMQTYSAIGISGGEFITTATLGRFSSWSSPLSIVPAANSAERYFQATFKLSGTAENAAMAPGFRLLYMSYTYAHLGGIQVITPPGLSTFNAPFTGNNRTLKLAWAVPRDLVEYADTGKLNRNILAGTDMRDYSIQFDLMQLDASDWGSIMLENLLIEECRRTASVTPSAEWGGTGTAFNAGSAGWAKNFNPPPDGFAASTATITASNMTLALTGTNTSGFWQLVPASTQNPGFPAWTNGKMLRTTYQVASSDPALTPNIRFLTIGWTSTGLGPVFWGDTMDFTFMRSRVEPAQSPSGLPGSYKAAGSRIEFYAPSQYAGTGAESAVLTPTVDICQPAASYPVNGWQRPSATVTISNVKIEVLGE